MLSSTIFNLRRISFQSFDLLLSPLRAFVRLSTQYLQFEDQRDFPLLGILLVLALLQQLFDADFKTSLLSMSVFFYRSWIDLYFLILLPKGILISIPFLSRMSHQLV